MLLVIAVVRHRIREEPSETVLSTFVYLDSQSFVLPVERTTTDPGDTEDGIRSRKTVN